MGPELKYVLPMPEASPSSQTWICTKHGWELQALQCWLPSGCTMSAAPCQPKAQRLLLLCDRSRFRIKSPILWHPMALCDVVSHPIPWHSTPSLFRQTAHMSHLDHPRRLFPLVQSQEGSLGHSQCHSHAHIVSCMVCLSMSISSHGNMP